MDRMDPAAKNILALYPAPQFFYVTNATIPTRRAFKPINTMDARIDHRFSDRDAFYVRYSWNHTNTPRRTIFPRRPTASTRWATGRIRISRTRTFN